MCLCPSVLGSREEYVYGVLKEACPQGGAAAPPPPQAGMLAQPPANAGPPPPGLGLNAANLAALLSSITQGGVPLAQPALGPPDGNGEAMDVSYQAGQDPDHVPGSGQISGTPRQGCPHQTPTWFNSLEPWPIQPLHRPTEQQVQENLEQALSLEFCQVRTLKPSPDQISAVRRSVELRLVYVAGNVYVGGVVSRVPCKCDHAQTVSCERVGGGKGDVRTRLAARVCVCTMCTMYGLLLSRFFSQVVVPIHGILKVPQPIAM